MMRFLLVVILLLIGTPSLADQKYAGENTIWKNTVWEGDILIDGIVTVAPGVTLEVRPGTTVRFTRYDSNQDQIGEHEIFIQGRFIAQGTAEQPILFTSAEERPTPGDWGAINMMASMQENLLEHCRVEYAYRGFHAHFGRGRLSYSTFAYNRRAAQFQESDVQINACLFSDNLNGLQFRDSTVTIADSVVRGSYWGVRTVNSRVTMNDTLVENNLINGINFKESQVELDRITVRNNRRGLYLQRTSGSVARSTLIGNSEHGLFAEESNLTVDSSRILENGRSGVRVLNATLVLHNNQILDNDLFAIINDGTEDLQIVGNWWGSSDINEIATLVRDGHDRNGFGLVTIQTPLTDPPLLAE